MNDKDTMTRYGAFMLAQTIETYWRRRDFAGIQVERYETAPGSDTWAIRSNLVGGLPPTQTR